MKNKKVSRRNFLGLVSGIAAMPSLALSEERTNEKKIRGRAIQDPVNKQEVNGFINIPTVWGEQLKVSDRLGRVTIGLVEAIKKYTDIRANVDSHLYLSSPHLTQYPFVYIATDQAFELTKAERNNFENYLRNGGFALLESLRTDYIDPVPIMTNDYSQAEASLKQMVKDTLKEDARFLPIPVSHPLYHCFFDFDDGPPEGTEVISVITQYLGSAGIESRLKTPRSRPYLEGIFLDDRLAVVYSGKGYGIIWKYLTNNEIQQQMGVNFVVYALTQKGGIAQKE